MKIHFCAKTCRAHQVNIKTHKTFYINTMKCICTYNTKWNECKLNRIWRLLSRNLLVKHTQWKFKKESSGEIK